MGDRTAGADHLPCADAPGPARAALPRNMRLRETVALGVGGTIGGGIFVLVGAAAGVAGPGALLAFGLAFLAALAIAVPYAELACRYPEAGGGYAFARVALGRRWGFLMGWGFWGAYVFISGYVTLGFGGYLHALTGLQPVAGALGLLVACGAVNLAGVRLAGAVQVGVVLLALGGLLGFVAIGAAHVEAARFTTWLPHGGSGVLGAALLAFLAFGGFDMVAAAGEEVQRPERNLPLAILLTLMIVLGVYLAVAWVALGTMPWEELGRSSAPLADAARRFGGPGGARLMAVAAVLSSAATANAVLVVTSRISFAMARDGLLPAGLARVHASTGAPWAAVACNTLLLGAVAMAGSVRAATAVGGFLYVVHFVPPLLAVLKLRLHPGPPAAFRTPAPALVLPVAFGMCLVLLTSSGRVGALGGAAWLGAGLVLLAVREGRGAHARPVEPSTPRPGSRSR